MLCNYCFLFWTQSNAIVPSVNKLVSARFKAHISISGWSDRMNRACLCHCYWSFFSHRWVIEKPNLRSSLFLFEVLSTMTVLPLKKTNGPSEWLIQFQVCIGSITAPKFFHLKHKNDQSSQMRVTVNPQKAILVA